MRVWRCPPTTGSEDFPKASAEFELFNAGPRVVRVRSVESGCGCATPEVEPKAIEPGKTGVVRVKATPPPIGEKTVTFKVNTDSPKTPRLVLTLQMIGGRKPPFILNASGGLSWAQGARPGDTREFVVSTVERTERVGEPTVKCELPFLKFEKGPVTETPYLEPGTVRRRYTYLASLTSLPEGDTFAGEVTVEAPWKDDRARLPLYGEVFRPVRAVPGRLDIRLSGPDDRGATATLAVIMIEPQEALRVDFAEGPGCPLQAERIEANPPTKRMVTFAARRRPGVAAEGGVYHAVVRTSDSGKEAARVPVTLSVGDTP